MSNEAHQQKLAELATGVAWLRAMANGASGDVAEPPADLLAELASIIEAATPGWAQRDGSFEVPESVVCELKRPLKRIANSGAPDLTELRFRPPTAGETKQISLRARKASEEEAAIFMLSLLSEDKLNEKEVERLLEIDAERCAEKLAPFLSLRRLSAVAPR